MAAASECSWLGRLWIWKALGFLAYPQPAARAEPLHQQPLNNVNKQRVSEQQYGRLLMKAC